MTPRRCGILLTIAALVPFAASSAEEVPPEWLKPLTWRCIGPAAMGGRITAVSVYEADPTTYFVATASGGLLKTVNNGVTFEHQFDHEATVSLGDVCVAPSDRNVVWVGTGEANPRNSVSYGDGVYKSTDGGKTWKNMGLRKSFQIGKILIHPTNPEVVYVGALGRLYGPNEERGLYKTSDGGKSWSRIHSVDDRSGVIDMRMNPADPETLLVATYERQRDIYDYNEPAKKYGPGSGLYKTTDGGKSFRQLTRGLPTCLLGRIGIDYYRKDPATVYLILESEKIGTGPPQAAGTAYLGIQGEDHGKGTRLTRIINGGPAEKAGLQVDDVILALGDKTVSSYQGLIEAIKAHKSGDKVVVRLRRGKEIKEIEVTLGVASLPFGAYLTGQRENAQGKQGPDGYQYGGVYKSSDGGESWTRVNSLNPRPMYFSQIRVDPQDDRYVYVLGIALHRSTDGGKTFKPDAGRGVHADQHALWIDPRDSRHMIVGCDGGFYATYDRAAHWDHLNQLAIGQFYHVDVDRRRDYRVYGGLQDNGSWGGPNLTRTPAGPVNEDWFSVGGGDGFTCRVDPLDPDLVYSTSQYGAMRRRDLRTGEGSTIQPPKGRPYRFNWKTPFLLSHRNSRIFYCAGNYVFRSLDRGNDLRVLSPEITLTDRGSATALAESPRNPDVLYAGTDDGALWVTHDGGQEWANVVKNVGLPGPRYVASIEASRFADGRAYVVFDGHRSDDDNPYVFVTEDFGKSWQALRGNLPWGSTHCLREDMENPNLLFVGTEFGAWCSLDRGQSWNRLNTNLPTVAVHEFALHPTAGEVVAATHGRSLWILDVTPLRQLQPETLREKAALYRPATAIRWQSEPSRGHSGRQFVGENPPRGALLYYSLPKQADKVGLKVLDVDGKIVRELRTDKDPGLHKVLWDLRGLAAPSRSRRGPDLSRPVAPGPYRVLLTVDGVEFSQILRVEGDPNNPTQLLTESAEIPDDGDKDDDEEMEEGGIAW